MLTIDQLEKELKNGQLQNLYLFYGEELFLLESSLKKIKSLFGEMVKGINYITIDENNCKELIANIETPSFGYEKKLIIARNTKINLYDIGLSEEELKRRKKKKYRIS